MMLPELSSEFSLASFPLEHSTTSLAVFRLLGDSRRLEIGAIGATAQ
jgi:hypothetical protein